MINVNDTTWTEISPGNPAKYKPSTHSLTIARYQLLVEDIYKGKITNDTITILTGAGVGSCGVRFEAGEKYVVYGMHKTYFANKNHKLKFPAHTLWTNTCLRTTSYFQEEITEIRKVAKSKKKN